MITLNALSDGQTCTVLNVLTTGSMRRRFQDIGIIEGSKIECLSRSIFRDPVAYLIKDTVIAIRNEDAQEIEVELLEQ